MIVKEALSYGKGVLGNAADNEILLAFVLRAKREKLISHPKRNVSSRAFEKFKDFCNRKKRGEPIAYLIGHKEFFSLDFYVDPRVLIPRPETELLVEETIRETAVSKRGARNKKNSSIKICDVGTGSGCIAIALAKHIPQARIIALDISEKALEVARKNCEMHGVLGRIELIKSNLLERVMSEEFDVIVANLPYIAEDGRNFLQPEVEKYEPAVALFGGKDGLKFFKKLFVQIKNMRKKPRFLIAEIGFDQKAEIEQLIKKHFGKATVSWKNDLAGITRCFTVYV